MNKLRYALAMSLSCLLFAVPAVQAQEVFVGVAAHGVNTPFTLETHERGTDIQAGYRFAPIEGWGAIGKPAPFVIASVNTRGNTSFAGAGLSWKIGKGQFYARPEIGLVIHDGPSSRIGKDGKHTELGSRVLFAPGIGIGTQLSEQIAIEASWTHVSHARLFNGGQNPGIDMMGVRLGWRLR